VLDTLHQVTCPSLVSSAHQEPPMTFPTPLVFHALLDHTWLVKFKGVRNVGQDPSV
jgi:hypothetical protein